MAIDDGMMPNVDVPPGQAAPLVLGVYAFDAPFPNGCVAYVDDVVVEAG